MAGRRFAVAFVAAIVAAPALVAVPATATTKAADPTSAATVDLLKPGSRPRETLRSTVTAGTVQTASLHQELDLDQVIAGQRSAPTSVSVDTGVRMTVAAVDASGRRTINFAYLNSNVPALNGVTGSYTITDRGFTEGGQFNVPPGADPSLQAVLSQLEDQLGSLSTPLPEEAVGVGARWVVTQHPVLNGIAMRQEIAYELDQRDGSTVSIHQTLRQRAANQELDPSTLPPGASATLRKSAGGGRGEAALDLARVLPLRAQITGRIRQVIAFEQDGQRGQIRQTVTTNVTVQST
jgi:hypothetical protein